MATRGLFGALLAVWFPVVSRLHVFVCVLGEDATAPSTILPTAPAGETQTD